MTRWALSVLAAVLVGGIASPAAAGQCRHNPDPACWRLTHEAIYERENLIAFLEANPRTDDGYRAPIVTAARGEIWQLHAMLDPPEWRWTTPCCYSRPPIRIAWRTHRRHVH